MKSYLKFNKYRVLFFVGIVSCCLLIFWIGSSILPPANNLEPLEVLLLNQETEPVFYVTSQTTYNHSAIEDWLSEPSLPRLSAVSADLSELSPLSDGTSDAAVLNLTLELDNTKFNIDQITSDLVCLTPYFNEISLSVLPSHTITDEMYLDCYQALYTSLNNAELSSIEMIAYPTASSNLSLYNKDFITCIGTNLESKSDLQRLDQVYTYFANKKSLVVLDQIKMSSNEDAQTTVQKIFASYYLMAVKYPAIEMIFSPCIEPSIISESSDTLDRTDADFYLFNSIYSRLLSKPWITTIPQSVCAISPYSAIKDYDELSETVELILSPDAKILEYLNSTDSSYFVFFKWNECYLNINSSYPYVISIDTTTEVNGISRLSAILQEQGQESHTTYAIDLNVKNSTTKSRALRITSTTQTLSSATKPSNTYIPILMYHTVEDEVLPEKQNSHIETAVLDSQMKALIENGYTPINFYDLKQYADGLVSLPEHPILITMDDGYLNNYTNAYPIYKKYNIQATLFVSPFYMQMENTDRHFGWIAAQEMEDSGLIDIQPHGYNHTPLPYLSSKDVLYHASYAKGLIEYHLGTRDVSVLAYPQFRHNWRTVHLLDSLDYDFQIINLASDSILPNSASFNPPKLKRINVPNTMTPDQLIETLKQFTT